MHEREAYIALNGMERVGPVAVRSLVETLGSAAAIFEADAAALRQARGVGRELADAVLRGRERVDWRREVERAAEQEVGILTPVDEAYPAALREIHDPPLALYVYGSPAVGDRRAVAVVGTRRPTHYGRATAEDLSYRLGKLGFTIVSGLARGIDTAAHRGALKAGARTLAVLGGALDCLYPAENRGLAREIAGQGAVLSEFPFGRRPDKTTFPMRNRIVSGLTLGTVVVEAGPASGALITAAQALEQGRAVMAVPGRIDQPSSAGPHRLIRDGARLVECVDDILDELDCLLPSAAATGRPPAAAAVPLSGEEQSLLEELEQGEQDVDVLIRATGLAAARVNALLMGLEMKKQVRMLPGRMVERVPRR